jgi:N-acetylmuramoyl-L-alanine amidase
MALDDDKPPMAVDAPAERRIALVIGNGLYSRVPELRTPVGDAEAVAVALAQLGFDVVTGTDLDLHAIGNAQATFEEKLGSHPNVALLFYAGHAVQVDGQNYLIPIDAEITRRAHVASRALRLDDILERMAAQAGSSLIFLDSARDNPFAFDRGGRNGLARVENVSGAFIALSSAPDTVAVDAGDSHSPFTGALLKHIGTPGLSIGDLMIEVRKSVLEATRGRQEPWDHSLLRSRFCFVPPGPKPPRLPPPPLVATTGESSMLSSATTSPDRDAASCSDEESTETTLPPIPSFLRQDKLPIPQAEVIDPQEATGLVDRAGRGFWWQSAAQSVGRPKLTAFRGMGPTVANESWWRSARQARSVRLAFWIGTCSAALAAIALTLGVTYHTETWMRWPWSWTPLGGQKTAYAPSVIVAPGTKPPDRGGNRTDPPKQAPKLEQATQERIGRDTAPQVAASATRDGERSPLEPAAVETGFHAGSGPVDHIDKPVSAGFTAASNQPSYQIATMNPAVKDPLARTRFVIQLERAIQIDRDVRISVLPDPNRVVVELPDVKMLLPTLPTDPAAGLVRSIRGGLTAPGRSRVVIDVAAPVIVENPSLEKDGEAHRLVLEIAPIDLNSPKQNLKTQPSALGGVPPPTPRRAQRPAEKAATTFKPMIVIDPGHGGDDSGATKNGIVEKDAVLAFSKALRDKLNASGQYLVLMTRDTDVTVPVEQRRSFAEEHRAQLFISIGVGSAHSSERGAAIYSLREATANALRRSAKSEVSQSVLTGGELGSMLPKAPDDTSPVASILADLAQRDVDVTQERTGVLVAYLKEFIENSASMRKNAEREADFGVLMTATVPSVLIELGNVANMLDAQDLRSEDWRDKVSSSIAKAIDSYFEKQIARLPD